MTHCLSWYGDKCKFYRKDYEYLKLLAYIKARYFDDVYLDGILVTHEL